MEKVKVFKLNQNSKTMKRLSTSMFRFAILPIIDILILGLVIPTILFILNTVGVNLDMSGSFIADYIIVVIFLVATGLIIGIIDFIKYMKIQNSIVIKEDDKILFLYKINEISSSSAGNMVMGSIINNRASGIISLAGLALYFKGAREIKINNDNTTNTDLQKILENPRTIYKFYTDCKFIQETKKHFLFNGNKIGYDGQIKNVNFKIDKIYEIKREDI